MKNKSKNREIVGKDKEEVRKHHNFEKGFFYSLSSGEMEDLYGKATWGGLFSHLIDDATLFMLEGQSRERKNTEEYCEKVGADFEKIEARCHEIGGYLGLHILDNAADFIKVDEPLPLLEKTTEVKK